ncbi:maltose phosphorylase [Thalassobacillus devorans]|uniref:Maltose phosphorylase n=1 Tax=Thalassobacillus devorans TaxID=279813 RepID=A0ABQ1NST9_9BACI|nr:glycosyl hydrolase family 65 protein [Thalassobacillus devorans]NIK28680.1 putative glycosyl hydrolase [Thalassobacillus devorans]GGC84363.1 maltose phosphorylase [Thalassobacillus devorans]
MTNLKLSEDTFNLKKINKYATLMTLGNGYIGLRGTHEENYFNQKRGFYVAGIYNYSEAGEPEEIVNLPDVVGHEIEIDGQVFSSLTGKKLSYDRTLHMDRGEVITRYLWEREDGLRLQFAFHRLVAKHDLHVIASKVMITSMNRDVTVKLRTGIDAQQTNHGRQHVKEKHVQVHEEKYLQGTYETTNSGQTITLFSACAYSHDCPVNFFAKNRQLLSESVISLGEDESFQLEKFTTVETSNDGDVSGSRDIGLEKVKHLTAQGYDEILKQSARAWKQFWDANRIEIHSPNPMDQKAIDFAQYHLEIMTPKHSNNISIGAKGLTGEGYKGHVFWDSEIFMLPYHLYNDPEVARQLLEYRYQRMPEAKNLATEHGYHGAQFPWESARTGKEETPKYAAINIRTGERQKVASALAEHHIVADIAFAVLHYYRGTGDEDFMKEKGLEMLVETSKFWLSRAEEVDGRLQLLGVIGPDEYTEFIDNNAYTNYMVHYTVQETLDLLRGVDSENQQQIKEMENFLDRLYLPEVNADNLIPQDDTFLNKPIIDLAPYKQQQGSQSILLDYSRTEVNEMQILKQADVVMLLFLLPDLFSRDVVEANYRYYEARTIHDSSLSKAIHAILAMRCGHKTTAYQFFQEACLIDLGPNPHSSDDGIHAASLGSIWLALFNFLNLNFTGERFKIDPVLPDTWTYFKFPFSYRGRRIVVEVSDQNLKLSNVYGKPIGVEVGGNSYQLTDYIEIPLPQIVT